MIASNLLFTIANRHLGKKSTKESGKTWPPVLVIEVGTTAGCFEHNFQAGSDMSWVP